MKRHTISSSGFGATLAGMACLFLAFISTQVFACDPEPGPNHFARPVIVNVPPPPVEVGFFEVINSLTGLPCDRIRAILPLDNLILVGTDGGGLLIGDGFSWQAFHPASTPPFPEKTVTSLASYPDENAVLAGTPSGLVKVTLAHGTLAFEALGKDEKPVSNVTDLCSFGERFYVALDRGAGMVQGNQIAPFSPKGLSLVAGMSCVRADNAGIWFGGSGGLHKATGGSLSQERIPDTDFGWVQALLPNPEGLLIGGSTGLHQLRQEGCMPFLPGVWITAMDATPGITRFGLKKGGPGVNQERSEDPALPSGKAPPLLKESELPKEVQNMLGEIDTLLTWFTDPANNGKPEFQQKADRFRNLYDRTQRGIAAAQPRGSILQSEILKGLWVGTQDRGFLLFSEGKPVRHYTMENSRLPNNHITCISTRRPKEAWIGTAEGGIFHYSTTLEPGNATEPKLIMSGNISLVRMVNDNLYIGTTDDGLFVYDPRSLSRRDHFNPDQPNGFHRRVTGVGVDNQARLWVSGDQGVFCLQNGQWRKFGEKNGLPRKAIEALEIDADSRIYVAGPPDGEISRQVFQFNGAGFISYGFDTIRDILRQGPASTTEFLKGMGLIETYQRDFDYRNATQALTLYDSEKSGKKITALLGTAYYLMIGSDDGSLQIFDGEGFKPLSSKGFGSIGAIVGLKKRPNGDQVIAGKSNLVTFDGRKYHGVSPIPMAGFNALTDLCMDDLNPDTFWVSFGCGAGGGAALYQKPFWKIIPFDEPVQFIAVSDPHIFFGTKEKVYRLRKR